MITVSPSQITYYGLVFKQLLFAILNESSLLCCPDSKLNYQAYNAFKRRYGIELTEVDMLALQTDFDRAMGSIVDRIHIQFKPLDLGGAA